MFYSAKHGKIINLGNMINADHAADLSYLILWMRGGETITLDGKEARACAHVLADRCNAAGDTAGAVALRTLAQAVEQQETVSALVGAR